MSRVHPDLRIVREQWSTGEAIAVIVAFILALLAIIGIIAMLAPRPAHARDAGQWVNSDPAIAAWYRSLMQPDNPTVSCCGEADAYWADQIVVEDDKVFAVITDTRDDKPLGRPHIEPGTRIEIPKWKYKFDRGNPTGHNILFVGASGVYCFVQGSGA